MVMHKQHRQILFCHKSSNIMASRTVTMDLSSDEETSAESQLSHNNNQHNTSRTTGKQQQYHLSCGMVLPKRQRRSRFHAFQQQQHSKAVVSHKVNFSSVSHETSSSMEQGKLHQQRSRTSATPFQLPLMNDGFILHQQPFQDFVTERTPLHDDAGSGSSSCHNPKLATMTPIRTRLDEDHRCPSQSVVTVLHRFDHCRIQLSSQIYTMADALELSANPHCIIEAAEPYRVIHSNAALYAALSRTNHREHTSAASFQKENQVLALHPSSWMDVNKTNVVRSSSSSSSNRAHGGSMMDTDTLFGSLFQQKDCHTVVTLYPVGGSKNRMPCTAGETSHIELNPRYYFLEILTTTQAHPVTTTTTATVQVKGNPVKHHLDDCVAKMVVA
jgi:hypothetical protein